MATLDDLKVVLDSIDINIARQGSVLSSMLGAQQRQAAIARADRSTPSARAAGGGLLGGAGALAAGTGSLLGGVGGLAAGIGRGVGFAGAGIGAALFGLSSVIDQLPDGQEIKDNVETLLTIGEGYESRLDFFLDGGTLALMLGGLGAGLAAFAIGSGAAVGVQAAIEKFEMQDWPDTVKRNVETLLSIGDGMALGNLQLLAEGGMVSVALAGLGVGLAAFATGSGVQAAVDYFAGSSDWAENVKNNVNTLLSIGDDRTLSSLVVLFEGVGVSAALAGLGVGLTAFAAGSGVQAAVDYFSDNNWAERVKSNVETLLSISELEGVGFNTAGFIATMGGIALGLAAFALGKGVEGLTEGAQETLSYFSSQEGWAQRIVDQVSTLLTIPSMDGIGANTAGFIATMGGITLGLAAFALGKGVEGLTEGAQEALSYFTSEDNFADRIYNQVSRLMEVTDLVDGDGDTSRAGQFALGLAKISAGLVAFTGADFVGQLAGIGQEILGFFGVESPFEKIMQIADKSAELEEGANAIARIAEALNSFADIRTGAMDIDFQEFAENLGEAIPLFYHLANGGVYDPWGLGNSIDFGPERPGAGGILNPDLRLDEVARQIMLVRQAMQGVLAEGTMEALNLVGSGAGAPGAVAETGAPVVIDARNQSVNTNAPQVSTSSVAVGTGNRSDLDQLARPGGVN